MPFWSGFDIAGSAQGIAFVGFAAVLGFSLTQLSSANDKLDDVRGDLTTANQTISQNALEYQELVGLKDQWKDAYEELQVRVDEREEEIELWKARVYEIDAASDTKITEARERSEELEKINLLLTGRITELENIFDRSKYAEGVAGISPEAIACLGAVETVREELGLL